MSVLIRDMEMPGSCATCHFCHTENFRAWCCITEEDIEVTDMTAIQEDCPLSEEPERKKGKWIPQDMNKSYGRISTAVYYYPKCSVCGWSADNTNFCPNCGSDMWGNPDD